MSNEIPRRLVKVVDNASVPVDDLPRPELTVGQIWIAQPDDGPDMLVLVTDVADDHVEALLCTRGDDHMATETDAVLGRFTTGCPGRLLVHGDVAGSIMRTRLAGSAGRVDPALVRRIVLRGRGLDFNSRDLGRGTPIASETDPRWDAKMRRIEEFRAVKARAADLGLKIKTIG
jgi:hypothetical protein